VSTIDGIFAWLSAWEMSGARLDVIYDDALGPAVVVVTQADGSNGVFSISLRR
jgi:hypothetical protein